MDIPQGGSSEPKRQAVDGFAPLRRAPAPRKYYDLGGSSMVAWQEGDDRTESPPRFYSLGDLELRLEREESLPPAVLIFHSSRCGSTLLARLLEIDPANRVFIEPRGLREFIHSPRLDLDSPETRQNLRVLLRSYGLEPRAGEKRLIIKLHSLALHALPALRAALPTVDFIYLLRDPAEVVASLHRGTPRLLGRDDRPALAAIIGAEVGSVASDTDEQWWSRYLEWNLDAAYSLVDDFSAVVDYRDFATRFLGLARTWSDLPLAADDPEVVRTLGFHAKKPGVKFSATEAAEEMRVAAVDSPAYARWSERLGRQTESPGRQR